MAAQATTLFEVVLAIAAPTSRFGFDINGNVSGGLILMPDPDATMTRSDIFPV